MRKESVFALLQYPHKKNNAKRAQELRDPKLRIASENEIKMRLTNFEVYMSWFFVISSPLRPNDACRGAYTASCTTTQLKFLLQCMHFIKCLRSVVSCIDLDCSHQSYLSFFQVFRSFTLRKPKNMLGKHTTLSEFMHTVFIFVINAL